MSMMIMKDLNNVFLIIRIESMILLEYVSKKKTKKIYFYYYDDKYGGAITR